MERTVYVVKNEHGRFYRNRNSGHTRWVDFEQAQIFNVKGTASAAANRTNGAFHLRTEHIPAEVVPCKLICEM